MARIPWSVPKSHHVIGENHGYRICTHKFNTFGIGTLVWTEIKRIARLWRYLITDLKIMNVNSADVHRIEVPMSSSFGSAHHENFAAMESVIVILTDEEGNRGIGTADATPGYSLQTHEEILSSLTEKLLPEIVRSQPANPNELLELFNSVSESYNAKCAAEMAFLDLYSQRRGHPFGDVIGGVTQEYVPLNGWVGIDTPENMAAGARRWRDKGYQSLKIKLSGDPETDIERVHAVCDSVGDDVDVRADANTAYDVDTAIEVAQELEAYPLEHLEQPVSMDNINDLAAVTKATSTPIMADESITSVRDVYNILCCNAADRIKIKILRIGGVLRTWQALDITAAANVPCVVGHGFGLLPATSAELQLTAAHSNIHGGVEAVGMLKMAKQPFTSSIEIADGSASVPKEAGLGVNLTGNIDQFSVSSLTIN